MAAALRAAQVLGGLRMTVGLSTWAVPALSLPFFGLARPTDHSGVVVARLFGVRDFAMAAAVLLTLAPADRALLRAALLFGVFCDSVDVVATAIAYFQRGIGNRAGVLVGVGAAFFAALGGYALSGL